MKNRGLVAERCEDTKEARTWKASDPKAAVNRPRQMASN
jgi:hypothetical protein